MNKKATSISYKGTIEYRNQSNNLLTGPGDFVIVKREIRRLIIVRCPCGCGDDLLINLDSRSGPAWRFYKKSSKYSLYPSYWRDTACGSHFIIWNSRIHWSYEYEEDVENWEVSGPIEALVLGALPEDRFSHYLEVADKLELIPWECLQACKLLVKKGLAKAKGNPRYEFRRNSRSVETTTQ